MTEPAVDEDGGERLLFHDMAAQRLRARVRWAGGVLVAALLIPYEVIGDVPQWIWSLFSELPPAAVVAALAPTLGGLALLTASRLCKRPASLAVAVVAALLAVAGVVRLGADASAWEALRLPESLVRRPWPAIVAMALAGAGANLTFQPHTRRLARVLFATAWVALIAHYAWPVRGQAPFMAIVAALRAIPDLPDLRFQIGMVVLVAFAGFPLLAVAVATTHLGRPATRDQTIAGLLCTFGLPALLLLFVYRALLLGLAGAGVLATIGTAALLSAVLALLTAVAELLGDEIAGGTAGLELPAGLPLPRAAAVGVAAVVVVLGTEAVLARPPRKGVSWELHAATDAEKKLYGEAVLAWSAARRAWASREGQSAAETVRLKAAERAMREAAKGLDPGVAAAFDALARESDDLDVAGRKFHRLVMDVNEAARKAAVPFYLDPIVVVGETKEGLRRTFRVSSYQIEAVRPVKVDGRDFATLHVKTLGGFGGHGARLGFSRDAQPFALVVLDEIAAADKEWQANAATDPPTCLDAHGFSPAATRALRHCGKLLKRLAEAYTLRKAVVTLTERHELQHQIDGPHLPISPWVEARLAGYVDHARERANRELSAYLAEMTSDAPPHLGLVHALPFALLARGGAEHHVAVMILYGLTDRKIPGAAQDGVDDEKLADAFDELVHLDDEELRARAARGWKAAFGGALPKVSE